MTAQQLDLFADAPEPEAAPRQAVVEEPEYRSVPPKSTSTMRVRYVYRGRAEPLPYPEERRRVASRPVRDWSGWGLFALAVVAVIVFKLVVFP